MNDRIQAWVLALLLGGCAAEAETVDATPPKEEVVRDAPPPAEELRDARRLVVDVAANRACREAMAVGCD